MAAVTIWSDFGAQKNKVWHYFHYIPRNSSLNLELRTRICCILKCIFIFHTVFPDLLFCIMTPYEASKVPWKELVSPLCCISVQFSLVTQSCTTLCDPMDCSTPGLPVHHQLPEFTQTHVHWVGDAIQPSHPLSSPSPPAPNPSQHQSLFKWVSSSHQLAQVLEFQLQHQSFQWTPRTDLL